MKIKHQVLVRHESIFAHVSHSILSPGFRSIVLLTLITLTLSACQTWRESHQPGRRVEKPLPMAFETFIHEHGMALYVDFEAGRSFNHPLMAIWVEDLDSNYIQTLYIAQSIAEGIFRHGDVSSGRWLPGPMRRPAALPYWSHQRGIQATDGLYIPTQEEPMPDAVTGATPKGNFTLKTQVPAKSTTPFRVLFEINQSWDWNHYWTNDKFPGDNAYMASSQPAVVYEAIIDPGSSQNSFGMKPIGHSHWSGENGILYEDLSTLTTALEIAGKIIIRVGE